MTNAAIIKLSAMFILTLAACGESSPVSVGSDVAKVADEAGHIAPTQITAKTNRDFAGNIDLSDTKDFDDAKRGLIATEEDLVITDAKGALVWSQKAYDFIGETVPAPASVNPSLWRQEQLNSIHGLFKVTEGVYQVRGYDLANMSIIEGETGWILVDPLTVNETAARALALVDRELGQRPVTAVIYTHSHMDHFAGVKGVVSAQDVASGKVRIIAPEGFMDEVVSENIIAGPVMTRRVDFMLGKPLYENATGHVGTGLGKGLPKSGTYTVIPPTDIIDRTGQVIEIDGVTMVFQNTPHAEAPAELMFYLPQFKAFCGAEIVSRNMHNLYTLRGAKVRDGLRWSGYIDEAIELFGGKTEVIFNSHHWPVFGNQESVDYLKRQRDTYKFIHDQSVRLASQGMTPREIAETIVMPQSLASDYATRGYYGTAKHNSKAVYQFYFGWFDGNPANLDPLPPVEEGSRYVDAMGGADAVLAKAATAYEAGDYRWSATLLNNLVFAAPDNDRARVQLAEVYDQLGYRAESGPWRDVYLTGATELRHGSQRNDIIMSSFEILGSIPLEKFFTSLAVRLDADKADGKTMTINFKFTDVGETHVVTIENSVMHHWQKEADPAADATVVLTRGFWLKMLSGQTSTREMVFSDDLNIEGSKLKVVSFLSMLDRGVPGFPIVTP